MAPEQAAGRRRDVGPPTDTSHALGVTLYEVSPGSPRRSAATMRPRRSAWCWSPSRFRRGRSGRDCPTATWRPSACLECLHKETARRYATAGGLRDDLRRFLDSRPIRARRTSAAGRAWRWCRRHKAATGLLAAVFLADGRRGRRRLDRLRPPGRPRAGRSLEAAEEDRARDEADRARAAQREMRRHWYAASVNLMRPAWDSGQIARLRELLAETRDYPDRGFEGSCWRRRCHLERSTLMIGHPGRRP